MIQIGMESDPTAFLEFKLPIIDSISSSVTASSKNEFKVMIF